MNSESLSPVARLGLWALASFCTIAFAFGCDKQKSQPVAQQGASATPVTLTLDWRPEPEFGGFYQAREAGAFKSRGLNVTIQNNGSAWQLVANGQSDFGTTSADQVLLARSRGADIVALFAVYQTSPQGIMVHGARGFTKIDDVFTHAGVLGAENNAWLKFLLSKFPSPTVKVAGIPQGLGVFMAQADYSQQCFVTSEPLEAKRQKGDPQTFLVADAGFNPYVTVLITSGATLKNRPEVVNKMVAACGEGWRAYLDDPAPANAAMGKLNTTMDAQTFTDAAAAQMPLIETEETKRNGLGTMTAERWRTLGQQLVALKVLENAPPAEECFVNSGAPTGTGSPPVSSGAK